MTVLDDLDGSEDDEELVVVLKPVPGCDSCAMQGTELNECRNSQRPCGHHCNCSWVHDKCHWCGAEFGEDGEVTMRAIG